ncbi:MAG: S8 family serine peptidase, partial [Bacteroidales bacterium]|nr:S8 family serine peptidase [Bacteroidales bacterium]
MKRLLLLVSILMLSLFGVLNAQTINPGYIDGHLYFKFNDDYDFRIKVNENTSIDFDQMPAEFTEMFERYGVTLITRPLYAFNDPKLKRIIRLEFTDAQNIRLFIKELEMLEDVEYAEMVPYCTSKVTYNDPYYTSSTYQGVIPINYKWHLEMINAPQAWGIQQGSSSIKVAIVDNAVWGNHPDLQIATSNQCSVANGTAVPGNSAPPTSVSQSTQCSDLTGNNCPVYDWSHGTHCAGLVGAINNNGVGISSIGGGVTLIGVRAGNNDGEMYYNINGVAWAVNNGAKVVSMSYGSTQQSTSERTAYQSYYDNGVILVAAAGNEGDSDNSINYPAGYSTVISVASVNSDGKLSDFSQHGTGRADVAAPGGFQIYNYSGTDYDIVNILSTTYCKSQYLRLYGYENPVASGQYYDGMQGTSMATPIVAGLCGLMASAYPNITPAQAKQCLISTGTALASGSNTIDNNVYVNAYAAVQCAQSYSNSLVVTPTSLTLPSTGGSETVSVRAGTASSSWTASSNQSWLSISPATGSGSGATTNMTVTANSANETGSPRTATVTITHGSSTATVTVTQSDNSDQCVTANEEIMEDDSCGYRGWCSNLYATHFTKFAQKINVTGNYTLDKITLYDILNTATSNSVTIKVWSATSAGLPDSELYSQTISMSTLNNALSQGQLTGGATCYYGNYEHNLSSPITVTGPFFVGWDVASVGAAGDNDVNEIILSSTSNGSVMTNSLYTYYSNAWRLVSSVFQNPPTNVAAGFLPHICPTDEQPSSLSVSPSSLSYTAAGESKTVTVTSNTSWTATSSASWLTISPASGSNNGTITAVAAANTSSSQRTATITVSGSGITRTISVTQAGVSYNLTVNPT